MPQEDTQTITPTADMPAETQVDQVDPHVPGDAHSENADAALPPEPVETHDHERFGDVQSDISVTVSEDGKTATFSDGSTVAVTPREDVVKELGEEEVARIEAEALTPEEVAADEAAQDGVKAVSFEQYLNGSPVIEVTQQVVGDHAYNRVKLGNGQEFLMNDEEYKEACDRGTI